MNLKRMVRQFFIQEKAAEVTELGIVLALVVAGAIGIIALLGPKVEKGYSSFNSAMP